MEFNPEQQQAIRSRAKWLQINAGPGTGKTSTLLGRVYHLLRLGVDPDSLVVFTFSRKAVAELVKRTSDSGIDKLKIKTFHAFAFETLIDRHRFKLANERQLHNILLILKENPLIKQELANLSIKDLNLMVSNLKLRQAESILVKAYQQLLAEQGLIDFDDLLLLGLKQLEEYLKMNTISHLLVDEFQDTNDLQYKFIKTIAKKGANLFVIGDPLQSIYSFRGADNSIYKRFQEDFPNAKQITLNKNYRSPQQIISAGYCLFPDTEVLDSQVQEKGTVELIKTLNEYTEAEWIIKKISSLIGGTDLLGANETNTNLSFKDFCIIYRTHHSAAVLGKKFLESGIPFQQTGNLSPLEEASFDFFFQILAYINEPEIENLRLIFRHPFIGLKEADLLFLNKIEASETDLYSRLMNTEKLSKKTRKFFGVLRQIIAAGGSVNEIFANFEKLLELGQNSQASWLNDFRLYALNKSVGELIIDINNLREADYYSHLADKVTLASIHAVKGLEFEHVFVAGFNEGLIPFVKDSATTDLEEEKRLLFVAMTRARKGLYLLTTRERNYKQNQQISSFWKFLKTTDIKETHDEATDRLLRKRYLKKQKQSQLKLV